MDWLRFIKRSFSGWLRMSRLERRLFCWSWAMLPTIEGLLRVVGFRQTLAVVERAAFFVPRELITGGIAPARDAVDRAARHHLWEFRCLCRSLALLSLLAKLDKVELRIGVKRAEAALEAHAWIEHDGRAVGERSDFLVGFRALKGA